MYTMNMKRMGLRVKVDLQSAAWGGGVCIKLLIWNQHGHMFQLKFIKHSVCRTR